MSYTLKGHNKLDMAVNTALVLSDIVNQQGDQTGLLLFDTKVQEMLLPGKGPGHRTKILEALYHVEGGRDSSNYQEAFNYFSVKERHRSTIFLFTDFDTYEEAEEMSRVLTIVSKKHSVVVVLIKNENYTQIINQRAKNGVSLQPLPLCWCWFWPPPPLPPTTSSTSGRSFSSIRWRPWPYCSGNTTTKMKP